MLALCSRSLASDWQPPGPHGMGWYGTGYSRKESRATWHCRLDKPSLTPPKKVCPVVWTALYAMMAWSGWRIWSAAPSRERTHALRLWISQLATNAKWSGLFLGEQSPTLALADAIALEGMPTSKRPEKLIARPPVLLFRTQPGSPTPHCSIRKSADLISARLNDIINSPESLLAADLEVE